MSDLIQKLRTIDLYDCNIASLTKLGDEAADELERLETQRDWWEDAFQQMLRDRDRRIVKQVELEARLSTASRDALEEAAQKMDGNAKLCRELSDKLKSNGHHATAEEQRIRAEQTEGLAEAIRALSPAPAAENDGPDWEMEKRNSEVASHLMTTWLPPIIPRSVEK